MGRRVTPPEYQEHLRPASATHAARCARGSLTLNGHVQRRWSVPMNFGVDALETGAPENTGDAIGSRAVGRDDETSSSYSNDIDRQEADREAGGLEHDIIWTPVELAVDVEHAE